LHDIVSQFLGLYFRQIDWRPKKKILSLTVFAEGRNRRRHIRDRPLEVAIAVILILPK